MFEENFYKSKVLNLIVEYTCKEKVDREKVKVLK